ncbi:hypothetical protein PIB30_011520 [Stylosanthes scabra]|uniref:SNF2 N-terminal domain-containing protein n=1 Tax=Stylosanthes scabra TaxID=79078 RepID=A0ABU6T5M6_9FABA|nr:hypothetical protein [Stylosanthes scabra]
MLEIKPYQKVIVIDLHISFHFGWFPYVAFVLRVFPILFRAEFTSVEVSKRQLQNSKKPNYVDATKLTQKNLNPCWSYYKYVRDGEISVYHMVQWYRVVLDEAHTIKAHKGQGAMAAFALTSNCSKCLTGTPLQVFLEEYVNKVNIIIV